MRRSRDLRELVRLPYTRFPSLEITPVRGLTGSRIGNTWTVTEMSFPRGRVIEYRPLIYFQF
jgi:hypothetical protein